ncbi:MAG TPA: hypothetical protein VJ063_08875, partial [Verrucomicrobiae bacterium]|nr:hypothetical protein [Verrucomicrobiae bacterium]
LQVREEHTRRGSIRLIAFLSASALITKLNFFPLAFVPLALCAKWKQRGTFLLWMGVFTCIWLLPLGPHKMRFFAWVNGLAFQQGRYGYGKTGILPPYYLWTLGRLITENPWLSLSIGLSWATIVYGCIRWRREPRSTRRVLVLLGALALGQTLQVAMVAKYGAGRYLLPALMFCPLNLLLLIEFWRVRLPTARWFLWAVSAVVVMVAGEKARRECVRLSERSAVEMQIASALQNDFKDEATVYCYGSSSIYHALWFGNYWAGEHYTKELTVIFGSNPPRYVVHSTPGGSGEILRGSERKSFRDFERHSSFLLGGWQGPTRSVLNRLPATAKAEKVFLGTNEVLYRVTFE